jgi:hypothetical protein
MPELRGGLWRRILRNMDVFPSGGPGKSRLSKRGVCCAAAVCGFFLGMAALPGRADEIRLKDGKKLYGVIVAYEDNMFKVKTDFGYVLVEKDKIASIIPTTPAAGGAKSDTPSAAKKNTPPPAKNAPAAEPALASGDDATPSATGASAKSAPVDAPKRDNPAPKISNAAVKPELPAKAASTSAAAPAIKTAAPNPNPALAASATPLPPPPKEDPPANREEIQGNLYTNFTHGFRMYKAPSWNLNEDARTALPNAIVAMGTFNESTLLVVGQEKTKEPLDTAAKTVEKRLHEAYENYRLTSQRKVSVSGLPAVEYRYRGLADGHDWSGTLAVVARGGDIFTVLGMTYADTDLIQIQENVIARSIASLDFTPKQ